MVEKKPSSKKKNQKTAPDTNVKKISYATLPIRFNRNKGDLTSLEIECLLCNQKNHYMIHNKILDGIKNISNQMPSYVFCTNCLAEYHFIYYADSSDYGLLFKPPQNLFKKKDQVKVEISDVNAGLEEHIDKEVLENLKEYEKKSRCSSRFWYISGITALLLGLIFAGYKIFTYEQQELSWQQTMQPIFFSLIIFVLLGIISKYCFILGQSSSNESQKNADRKHAISFGKFYLKAHGKQNVKWDEVKEAFKNWNIESKPLSNNIRPDDIDPSVLKVIMDFVKNITKVIKS